MLESPLKLEVGGSIARLVLAAPPRNDMTLDFFAHLAGLCAGALRHDGLRGLIIHGVGRHFSSGADVAELLAISASDPARAEALLYQNHRSFSQLERLPYPVVAAIGGVCLGAGLELALACRYRVAARRAVFALPEVSFGLLPGCGGTVRLPRLVGAPLAIELILTGRTLLADEALAVGLVDQVVDRRDLISAAESMIMNGPVAPPKTGDQGGTRFTYGGL
jgi:enoyl-CoA hydratase/carnithine racemase